MPLYDSHKKIRKEETQKIFPSSLIIVEGTLIFCNKQLMDLMDLKVFIDTDDDVRLSRRVLKASKNYEKGDNSFLVPLLDKYERIIKPSFERHVEPTKKHADIIIPNYGFSVDDEFDMENMIIPIDLIIKRVTHDQRHKLSS
jgi:uridine kinase